MGWEMIYPREDEKQLKRAERLLNMQGYYVLGLRARQSGTALQIEKSARLDVIEMLGKPIAEGEDTRAL